MITSSGAVRSTACRRRLTRSEATMPDEIDRSVENEQLLLDRRIAQVRQPIPAGVPGECEECGVDMPRLVGWLCGYCRDGR